MPPLAALHILHTATTRTLHNRMKVALIIVSLFCLVVHYNDLTLVKDPISLSGFLLLHSAHYVWQDEGVVKF